MAARRFPVEAGHVLAFTRALGAADPPGGLPSAGDAAPPTFAIASAQFDPDYPLRRGLERRGTARAVTPGWSPKGPAGCTRSSTSPITGRSGSATSWPA